MRRRHLRRACRWQLRNKDCHRTLQDHSHTARRHLPPRYRRWRQGLSASAHSSGSPEPKSPRQSRRIACCKHSKPPGLGSRHSCQGGRLSLQSCPLEIRFDDELRPQGRPCTANVNKHVNKAGSGACLVRVKSPFTTRMVD